MAESIKGVLHKILTTTEGLACIVALCLIVVAFVLCLVLSVTKINYGIRQRVWFFLFCVGIGLTQMGLGKLFNFRGYGLIVIGLGLLLSAIIVSLPTKQCKKINEGHRAFIKYLTDKAEQASSVRLTKQAGQALSLPSTDKVWQAPSAQLTDKTSVEGVKSIENIHTEQEALNGEVAIKSPSLTATKPLTQHNQTKGFTDDDKIVDTASKNPQIIKEDKVVDKQSKRAPTQKADEMNYSHVKNVIARLEYFNLTPTDFRQVRELEINLLALERGEGDEELRRKINSGLSALLKIMSKYGI